MGIERFMLVNNQHWHIHVWFTIRSWFVMPFSWILKTHHGWVNQHWDEPSKIRAVKDTSRVLTHSSGWLAVSPSLDDFVGWGWIQIEGCVGCSCFLLALEHPRILPAYFISLLIWFVSWPRENACSFGLDWSISSERKGFFAIHLFCRAKTRSGASSPKCQSSINGWPGDMNALGSGRVEDAGHKADKLFQDICIRKLVDGFKCSK